MLEPRHLLPRGIEMKTGKVKRRESEIDETLKGASADNPLIDTRAYIIEFPDGTEAEYKDNIIAENMYAQCNPDGQLITDHIKKTEEALSKEIRKEF